MTRPTEKTPSKHAPSAAPGAGAIPMAIPVAGVPTENEAPLALPVAIPLEEDADVVVAEAVGDDALEDETVSLTLPPCTVCGAERTPGAQFCGDCGFCFPEGATLVLDEAAPNSESSGPATIVLKKSTAGVGESTRLADRFEVIEEIGYRKGVRRFRAIDLQSGEPVIVVSEKLPSRSSIDERAASASGETTPLAADDVPFLDEGNTGEVEILPGFDAEVAASKPLEQPTGSDFVLPAEGPPDWPSVAWEKSILLRANSPFLPAIVAEFETADANCLVIQSPVGRIVWDAWDEPDASAEVRFEYARQIALGLKAMHAAGGIIAGLNPDMIVVTDAGQPMLISIGDLLPLPIPEIAPIRDTLYTAPELILSPSTAGPASALYSFGALLYALEYLHHPLEEKDFEHPFVPKQITERFPDVHPLFLRLINKTFVRDRHARFPTDEASAKDATGFSELADTLAVCARTFDRVRLDIAAWTTTGMVRTGNEDAFTILHSIDARLDDTREIALVLLCDGMGGYEAGEIAAAMAIQELKTNLLAHPIFQGLVGAPTVTDFFDLSVCKEALSSALRFANRQVYAAARTPGKGRRGMGCTAEAVYIDHRNVVVGHVGDSRTYHLHRGKLVQLTRDHTLVNRLVELKQISPEEAENHPRKNELQQAIGGQPEAIPGVSSGILERGDWVLVCSDGLTNHISNLELEKMLTREAAGSAEEAARRLVNLANLRGATDNSTIVVIRAT